MPRRAKELSDLVVSRLKKPGLHAVGGPAAGLHLQVTASGARSWVLRITVGTRVDAKGKTVQRRRDMGLGAYPVVTLKLARKLAGDAHEKLAQKIDPVADRRAEKSAKRAADAMQVTFREASRRYIEAKSSEWTNAKHGEQWTNTLEKYAHPVLGAMLVRDIELPHILRVLEPIWTEVNETASRVRSRVEAVLGWAGVHGYRSGDNPARWRDHLDQVLPSPAKVKKVRHHPALPLDQVGAFMRDLRARDNTSARALEFTALTAARTGEVINAEWREFDLAAALWIVPAERMKAKVEHRVPLSKAALRILRTQKATATNGYVFPGGKEKAPLSSAAMLELLKDMAYVDKNGERVTTHGLRSSFRDWCSEHTDYPREIAEMALAHTIDSKVEAAYRRGDLLAKRRAMMTDWETFCGTQKAAKAASATTQTAAAKVRRGKTVVDQA